MPVRRERSHHSLETESMFATGKPARHRVVVARDERAPLALNREPACTSHGCFLTLPRGSRALDHSVESQTHDRAGIKTQEDP